MRVLIITKKIPFPMHDGEAIAVDAIARGLQQQGASIDLVALNASRQEKTTEVCERFKEENTVYANIFIWPINTEITWLGGLINLFSGRSYHIDRFDHSVIHNKLLELLSNQTYDVIQLESLFLGPYIKTIRRVTGSILSMRLHNIEHEVWSRVAHQEMRPLRSMYLRLQSARLKVYETTTWSDLDLLIPISHVDNAKVEVLLAHSPSRKVVEVGMDLPLFDVSLIPSRPLRLGFIGSMDWQPNILAMQWWRDQLWPALKAIHGNHVRFVLAGHHSSDGPWVGDDIEVMGRVGDVDDFFKAIDVMVVPIRSGSGVRIKILQAMATGIPVVSTTIGAEGILAESGNQILLANTRIEWTQAIGKLLSDGELYRRLSAQGYDYIRDNHAVNNVVTDLIQSYYILLAEN